MDGMSVFMSKDDKARKLLMAAWSAFTEIVPVVDFDSDEERAEVEELVEKIIRGTS